MRKYNRFSAFIVGAMLMFGAAHAASYIKFEGVHGESRTSAGSPQFEVESWSWGATQNSASAAPEGNGPGVLVVSFKKGFSGRASVRSLYEGKKEIPSLILTTQQRGKTVAYELERVYIKSWSTSGDADDHPTEEVAFYYNKIAR